MEQQAIKIGMIAISAAVIVVSAAYCLAKIAASGLNAMARQPEIADKAKEAMVMPLVLIESAVLIGAALCGFLGTR